MILSVLVIPYKCFVGRCSSMYGKHINGNNDSLAFACALDPNCKAYRYSEKNNLGYLCNDSDARYSYDDWKLCSKDPG